jgi:hypothetical protein
MNMTEKIKKCMGILKQFMPMEKEQILTEVKVLHLWKDEIV